MQQILYSKLRIFRNEVGEMDDTKSKSKSNISDELIEKILDDMEKAQETVDEDWDEETRKDWEEKMNS